MAEICYGVVTGAEAATEVAGEPSPRSARRRRMEVRRFKFVAGVDTMAIPSDFKPKRQKLDLPSLSLSTVENEAGGEDTAEKEIKGSSSDLLSTSNPNTSTAGSAGSEACPKYGVTSVCGRRRDMEDAVSIRPNFAPGLHFFGVFDGHGCSHVAVSCRDRMHEIVSEDMNQIGSDGNNWKEIMEESFGRMDAEAIACSGGSAVAKLNAAASCKCELQTRKKSDHVGSTAVVALVSGDRVVVANCGDSRAVLCRKGAPVPLSSDHKPDRPDELDRIQAAGGRVIYWDGARVFGVLAMSRAIGDSYLKPYVVSVPEVTVTERTEEDECLILASDGLWDVVSNEMACDIVKMCLRGSRAGSGQKACADAAMLLTKLALARQSADNVSVVVVDLRRINS